MEPTRQVRRAGRAAPTARAWLARAFRWTALGVLYVLATSAVLDAFMRHAALGDSWRHSRLRQTLEYRTPRPIVYRVLPVWAINAVAERLPDSAREALAAQTQELRGRYRLRRGDGAAYALAYWWVFGCLLGTILVWRACAGSCGIATPLARDLAPPLALLMVPTTTYRWGSFLYDPSELLLTGLALLLFLSRRWLLFYPVFALCVLNKETSILLPVWFLASYAVHRDRRFLLRHAAISVAVGAPLFLGVRWWFRDSPAYSFAGQLAVNVEAWLRPATYWRWAEPFAPHVVVPQGFHPLDLLLLAGVLVLGWRNPRLREVYAVFVATVVAILPLFVVWGNQDEIRVFGPAVAALFVLALDALQRWPVEGRSGDQPAPTGETT